MHMRRWSAEYFLMQEADYWMSILTIGCESVLSADFDLLYIVPAVIRERVSYLA